MQNVSKYARILDMILNINNIYLKAHAGLYEMIKM